MMRCKRFHWEDEFNEWAKKENIKGCNIVAITQAPENSLMVFYDKERAYSYYDFTTPLRWTAPDTITCNYSSLTVDGDMSIH